MKPAILALGTAVPPHAFSQKEIAEKIIAMLAMDQEKIPLLDKIYQNSAIEQRYSVVDDFKKPREEWAFWGREFPQKVPGMAARNLRYKQEAPRLSEEAARQALLRWGGEISRITHVIFISCTGVVAPGIEHHLMRSLGLSPIVNRLGINFMGCFGAFKGLSVACAFAQENPRARILMVCTELCSLHYQAEQDYETLLANSLFSDGSSALIIGGKAEEAEVPLWHIQHTCSLALENSHEKMTWEAGDQGFLIRLSPQVPALIKRHIPLFIQHLLKSFTTPQECDWAIHPGGKSILQAIERALQLNPDQTQSSWEVLKHYGNMSSATFLFVLHTLSQHPSQKRWAAGLGFGPGLSAEGILLQRPV